MSDKMEIEKEKEQVGQGKGKGKEKKKDTGEAVTADQIKKAKAKQDFSGELEVRLPQLRKLALEVLAF
jgi:hypothetical protein